MVDYEFMYHKIFNAATDAERKIFEAERTIRDAGVILRAAQIECEKMFVESEECPPIPVDFLKE